MYRLGDLISSYPDICKALFLRMFQSKTIPDGNYLFSLLHPLYSVESTSKRIIEESIMDHMQDLLMSFEDQKVTHMPAVVAWTDDQEKGEVFSTSSGYFGRNTGSG